MNVTLPTIRKIWKRRRFEWFTSHKFKLLQGYQNMLLTLWTLAHIIYLHLRSFANIFWFFCFESFSFMCASWDEKFSLREIWIWRFVSWSFFPLATSNFTHHFPGQKTVFLDFQKTFTYSIVWSFQNWREKWGEDKKIEQIEVFAESTDFIGVPNQIAL